MLLVRHCMARSNGRQFSFSFSPEKSKRFSEELVSMDTLAPADFRRLLAVIFLTISFAACSSERIRSESSEIDTSKPALEAAQKPTKTEVKVQVSPGRQEATAEYHFSMAQAYSAEGNSDQAIEEYKLTLMF